MAITQRTQADDPVTHDTSLYEPQLLIDLARHARPRSPDPSAVWLAVLTRCDAVTFRNDIARFTIRLTPRIAAKVTLTIREFERQVRGISIHTRAGRYATAAGAYGSVTGRIYSILARTRKY